MYTLKVGASRKAITPTQDMLPLPQAELNGDGQYTWVRKDVRLRAIVLDNGTQKLLFIVSESEMAPASYIRSYVGKKYGLAPDAIMCSNTHSHSCPDGYPYDPENGGTCLPEKHHRPIDFNENMAKLGKLCCEKTIEAIDEAFANMRPARFGHGKGNSYINVSRDEELADGKYIFGTNYQRPSDKTLTVLKFVDENDKMIAAILNYGVHSTMGFRVANEKHEMAISGDLAGEIAEFVEEAYKEDGAVVAWTIAAGANQTPIHSFFHVYHPDGSYEPDERYNRYLDPFMFTMCTHMAQRQGTDALKILRGITDYQSSVRIDVAERYLKLPATKVENFGLEQLFDDRNVDVSKLKSVDDPDHFVYIGLKLIKISDLAVYCVEMELMCEIGLRMKEVSPLKNLMFISCYRPSAQRDTHDEAQGAHYLVDKWGLEHWTAHGCRNTVKDAITEEKITEAMLDMFKEILNR